MPWPTTRNEPVTSSSPSTRVTEPPVGAPEATVWTAVPTPLLVSARGCGATTSVAVLSAASYSLPTIVITEEADTVAAAGEVAVKS